MKVEVISIGAQWLMGDILNTHIAYVAYSLREIQATLISRTTVSDDPDIIEDALQVALRRADTVLMIGGWQGTNPPTLTAVARVTERAPVPGTASVAGAVMLADEPHRPGMLLNHQDKTIVCLPGFRRELTYLLETAVLPYLQKIIEITLPKKRAILRTVGVMESSLKLKLADLTETDNRHITFDSFAGQTTIQLWAQAETEASAKKELSLFKKEVLHRLGNYIYGEEDDRLEQVLVEALRHTHTHLAVAECCTDHTLLKLFNGVEAFSTAVTITSAKTSKVLAQQLALPPLADCDDITLWCRQAAEKLLEQSRIDVSLIVYNNITQGGVQILVTLASHLGVSVTQRTFGGHPENINLWAATLGLSHFRRWLLVQHA
ncbi:MAG: molybdopterin-binding protein [Anaerolineae bacterium]